MFHLLSTLCAGMAAWLWFSPKTPKERLARLCPPNEPRSPADPLHQGSQDHRDQAQAGELHQPAWPSPTHKQSRPRVTRKTIITAAAVALLITLLIGGTPGIVAGLLTAPAIAMYLGRKEPQQSRHDLHRITADLPFAADLMAACLLAGRPVSAATEIAATAIGGPLGHRLTWVSNQLRLGADPEPTWAALARSPAMGQLSRAMSRAAQSGAPVADVLTRLADDARETARTASLAAARRVGVKAVAPLGLCFLPAFVLLGIIPVIAGLASTIIIP
ncbi:type II secretion system F family protein [Nonomuraea sp. B12E4]|uniref:type II secretion system F family protein n=1 Tax=Nonomuraea sp. B12E4 TaxID=3153564 RepID=UPI00325DC716